LKYTTQTTRCCRMYLLAFELCHFNTWWGGD